MEKKISEQSYAYTPGLKVKRMTTITKERKLPILGEVLVNVGDKVSYDDNIAHTEVPGDPYIASVAPQLGVPPEVLPHYMIRKEGDIVHKDEVIAKYQGFFGLIKRFSMSPVEGTIEVISDITGRIIIREPPVPVFEKAYISGKVSKVFTGEGAEIETTGAFIQGIFGVGGERHGMVKVLTDSSDDPLIAELITADNKGQVLVGGSLVTLEAIRKAVKVGATGVIVGGIEPESLKEFMGEVIGVAITGNENVGLTLIISEGFGNMTMSKKTFSLLKELEGYLASINGATQIRAGVMRPEIIIPYGEASEQSSRETEISAGMVPGTIVRVIREPYFGAIGRVVSLPLQLEEIETESKVRVIVLEIEDDREVRVPRANVEIIEE